MTDTATLNPILPDFWGRPQEVIERDLAELRSGAPVSFHDEGPSMSPMLPEGPGYWAVMRHADIVTVSRDPQTYSSAQGITILDIPQEISQFFNSMIAMDDPRHARLRGLVQAGFTARMMRQLEEYVRDVASAIVDDIAGRGEVDFVVDVSAALPLRIVCKLMGIPASQYQFVFDQTNVILGASDPEYVPEGTDFITALLEAGGGLAKLMEDLAESKRGGDDDDLTSTLINADVEGDTLSPQDLASFFILLVVAGNETTRHAISWGLHHLTRNPDQRALWQGDYERYARTAVEELVRLASPVTYMRRTVTTPTELGGQTLAEGDKVCLFYLSANRDESVFDNPYQLDITRKPNPHLGFGGPSPHFCLGASLAKMEIQVMFRELFSRLPDIEAVSEPEPLQSSFNHGIKHMTARFTPA